ncbi:MAG: glycosyltransferase family 2 protein, partial [Bacteroidales bacterium]|nr:glycosyltransferase family 2 protein [Bacteroidales bacterium]
MSLREVKVSVVIPVYTAGRFIGKCVESVLRQTLSQIEIICVDDFSTDDSLSILSTFTDPRLKVIAFPENRGVSAARNAGLDEAAGEYVYFIDSDDWL